MEDKKNELQLEVSQSVVETEQSEEQLQDVTELFEEPAPLSREQILEASRKENKNGDEREMQAYNKSLQLAFGVGMICLGVIMLVNVIVEDILPLEMWICFSAMMATMGLYYGIKTVKRKWLFLTEGIIGVITFIFMLVAWILKLCGIWLN